MKIAIEIRDTTGVNSKGIVEAVRLAIADRGGSVGGVEVTVADSAILPEGTNGANASKNVTALLRDPDVVAVVGPYTSGVTRTQIPATSERGLVMCSPSASDDALTKGSAAEKLRGGRPVNFIRTVMTNDRQGAATARFVLDSLGLPRAYVVGKGTGTGRALQFVDYWASRGGAVVDNQSLDANATDYTSIATLIKATNPDVVYFSGNGGDGVGAGSFFKQLRSIGSSVTFVTSGEAFNDKFQRDVSGFADSHLYMTYPAADYYASRPGFAERFGGDPGIYALTAYSCATAILDGVARTDLTLARASLREAVRASVVDPSVIHQSPMGEFAFDANGDSTLQILTTYQYDAGRSAWVAIGEITAP